MTSERRQNGEYYTPKELARVLVKWAINGQRARILDPSCGKGVFAAEAVDELRRIGTRQPWRHVFGIDIRPSCKKHFKSDKLLQKCHIITRDFLSVNPRQLDGFPFHAVVGNPPYVRHHWLNGSTITNARRAARHFVLALPARSSMWAYFVLHAINCLCRDGRLAVLVPEAILQTDYGKAVQAALKAHFRVSKVIRIEERFFEDTDEVAVVIAASGQGPGDIYVSNVRNLRDLTKTLYKAPDPISRLEVASDYRRTYSPECFDLLHKILGKIPFHRFEELAAVRIGLVTGANDFFVFSPTDVKSSGIRKSCFKPIITRASWLRGLDFSKEDRKNLRRLDSPSLLCMPNSKDAQTESVRQWLDQGESLGISKRYKCQAREPWYIVPMDGIPDAFITCSNAGYPRLSLNSGRVWSTNALNVANWNEDAMHDSVAVSFMTTVVAAYAELYGRWYGGGVLKVEPGLLKDIPVPFVKTRKEVYRKVDKLLRQGKENQARAIADDAVLREKLGVSQRLILRFRKALSELSAKRKYKQRGQ